MEIEEILWRLFAQTGEIRYFLFYRALEENKKVFAKDSNQRSM